MPYQPVVTILVSGTNAGRDKGGIVILVTGVQVIRGLDGGGSLCIILLT
ncbi:MAG: hypothetical protein KAR40_07135 [Candidatus Sabulitectum sp.]|nr:hypothetical protein [Candidatus Sabulitectum sp.]